MNSNRLSKPLEAVWVALELSLGVLLAGGDQLYTFDYDEDTRLLKL